MAALAGSVASVVNAVECGIHLDQMLPRLHEHGCRLCPLQGDRRPFWVVLVVSGHIALRSDQCGELTLGRGDRELHVCPVCQQSGGNGCCHYSVVTGNGIRRGLIVTVARATVGQRRIDRLADIVVARLRWNSLGLGGRICVAHQALLRGIASTTASPTPCRVGALSATKESAFDRTR